MEDGAVGWEERKVVKNGKTFNVTHFTVTFNLSRHPAGTLIASRKKKTFSKKVDSRKQRVCEKSAYAIAYPIYEKWLMKSECSVVFDELDTDARLSSDIKDWNLYGETLKIDGVYNRCLAVSYMKVLRPVYETDNSRTDDNTQSIRPSRTWERVV